MSLLSFYYFVSQSKFDIYRVSTVELKINITANDKDKIQFVELFHAWLAYLRYATLVYRIQLIIRNSPYTFSRRCVTHSVKSIINKKLIRR